MPIAKVIQFPPRTTLAQLCDGHTREDDDKLLRVIQGLEGRGVEVTFDEPKDEPAPQPYVSPYLQQPLRTEAEVRAAREPRIPRARGLLEMLAEQTGLDAAFTKIVGGK